MDAKQMLNEIIKCRANPLYFIENYILIPVEGTSEYTKFKLYEAQKKYIDALLQIKDDETKSGVIFLASRQCGKTRLTEAFIVWLLVMHNNYPVMFMTREKTPLGSKVMNQISEMIKNLPAWLHPKLVIDNATNIKLENNSEIILQASNKQVNISKSSTKGRGFTPLFVWIDEAAFLPLEEHLEALVGATSFSFQTARRMGLPHGIVLTSTPNGQTGIGKGFYITWLNANQNTDSAFIPVRLHWSEIPVYDEKWYNKQKNILRDERLINQEYELVFLGSNESVFSDKIIAELTNVKNAAKPIKTTELHKINGLEYWYDIPTPDKKYIIGVDTATSFGTDKSAIVAVEYESGMDVSLVTCKCSVDNFKEYISQYVKHFVNYAIAVERNTVGASVVEYLYSEPNIRRHVVMDCKRDKTGKLVITDKPGVNSTSAIRNLMFDKVIEVVHTSPELIRSELLRLQLASITNRRGKLEGLEHDDIVVAYGLTLLAKYYFYAEKYFNVVGERDIFDSVYPLEQQHVLANLEAFGIDISGLQEFLSVQRTFNRRRNSEELIFEIGDPKV